MTDLVLRDVEQQALRALMVAEPVPGKSLPTVQTLVTIARLVPCDAVGIDIVDRTGLVLAGVYLPRVRGDDAHPVVCDRPVRLGLFHVGHPPGSGGPVPVGHLAVGQVADRIWLSFRNGSDGVAHLVLSRTKVPFSKRDVAMMRLVGPTVQRLVRERDAPGAAACLTAQERRALLHVAAGRSNTEIAERLSIAPSTVRKHLEHAYRKLGVTSRLAAVVALQGRIPREPDLRGRIERFA